MSAWRPLLLALLLVLTPALTTTQARAQAPADLLADDDERVRFWVHWGFDGSSMIAERWTPLKIFIGSGPRAVSGTIEITYRQDASQTMRLSLPFSTTPGVYVPVEAVLALPSGCQSISVRVLDERGRRLRARTFSRNASRAEEQMPQILPSTGVPLLNVGVDGLEQVSPSLRGETFGADQLTRRFSGSETWSRLTLFNAPPNTLPASWMAYDAVSAIVLDDSEIGAIPQASLTAISDWVYAGGTLVLVADDPGQRWRSLLSRPGWASPVRLAPSTSIGASDELSDLVEVSPSASARPIALTGAAPGWSQRWQMPGLGSLIAEGPVGAGWVILLGVDPRRVPAIVSEDETAYLWREILREPVNAWVDELPDLNYYWGSSGFDPSGATPRHRSAIASILDSTLRAPPPGVGVFVLIILSVVVLALLLGPFDAIALKMMRKRQHSWATALLYIAIACVPASLAPVVLRSGATVHARSRCVDTLPPALGGGSFQTGLSSIFAGAPGPIRFLDPQPGSWWRPVSSLQTWRSTRGTGATLSCDQSARSTPQGLIRQTTPDQRRGNTQRLWTLRTTLDQGRAATSPAAQVDLKTSSLLVTGLAPEARVRSAVMVMSASDAPGARGRRWIDLQPGAAEAGAYVSAFDLSSADPTPPERWAIADIAEQEHWRWNAYARDYAPARLADLPGAWARTRALDAYVASGAYALLLLEVEHQTSDAPISVRADTSVLEVHRIIVPLEGPAP